MVNVSKEVKELRGVFSDVSRTDFVRFDDFDAIQVTYKTDSFLESDYEVVIAFPPSYPNKEPYAFVLEPEIKGSCPHIYGKDDGVTRICYIDPDEWSYRYTSYDAAVMIKSWIYAYSNWENTGNWDWEEAEH